MKKLLPLNLQYFAEENTIAPDAAENTENEKPAETQDRMIPKARFDEVNQKFKDVQAQLEEFRKEKQESERKAQEEAGEFQKLYETTSKEYSEIKSHFESMGNRNKELEGVINTLLETRLKGIPEDFHDLIPGNLTPEAKLEWINKAETKGLFGKEAQQPVGEQTNGNEFSGITKEQFAKMGYVEKASLFTKNPDLYKKLSR
jgi:hypothetical protein